MHNNDGRISERFIYLYIFANLKRSFKLKQNQLLCRNMFVV